MLFKKILDELRSFVKAEQEASKNKLMSIWEKPLAKKLESGETQAIAKLEVSEKSSLWLTLGNNESRFREGDMICLHTGIPHETAFVRQATIEAENDGQWLVRPMELDAEAIRNMEGPYYADVDGMDLRGYFDKALDDIASSTIGHEIILPLLAGQLNINLSSPHEYDAAAHFAASRGLNDHQIEAVGNGVAATYLACIQGPPGTGKTKVISVIAKLLVDQGKSVLLTSHTHMAINNALNKIQEENIPVIKVGGLGTNKGLNAGVKLFAHGDDWEDRPGDGGYVIGATPFATCTSRLENFEFDTVIFDEASQITVPLAVMAMRKAKRFVFVGDHKQLPPVVLSKSVLDASDNSIFATLISMKSKTSVMLKQTYRMNKQLSQWPSVEYYNTKLTSIRSAETSRFILPKQPLNYIDELSGDNSFVFIKSPGVNARTSNIEEAKLVCSIIASAIHAGINAKDIGVVTPFRNQAKIIKKNLSDKLGWATAKDIVTDTVERMQGQEREMILISLCATDLLFIKNIASFLLQPERLNVAITRPKTKLILIGPDLPEDFIINSDEKSTVNLVKSYRSLVQFAKGQH
ncbi:MAG: AAA domain-containing protein [Pseudomonadota bacterium]